MTRRRERRRRDRLPLPFAAAVGLALAAVGCGPAPSDAAARVGDDVPAEAVRTLHLVFHEDADERIVVTEEGTGRVLRTVAPGEGGFLRGVLRPLRRERARHGVEVDRPYALVLRSDGTLVLDDAPTGMSVDVAAFGATSREHFLTLLDGRPAPAHPTLSAPNGTMEDRP